MVVLFCCRRPSRRCLSQPRNQPASGRPSSDTPRCSANDPNADITSVRYGSFVVLRYNFQKTRSRSIIGLRGLLLMGGESIEVDQPWIVGKGRRLELPATMNLH